MQAGQDSIEALLARAGGRLWRGRGAIESSNGPDGAHWATGHAALDAALPGGGWPAGALSELLLPEFLLGEVRLLAPVMRALNRDARWISWLNPPAIPYAPGLAQAGLDLRYHLWLPALPATDAWWALEQLARQPASGLALAWVEPLDAHSLRRLQLAAETGGGLAVLCRPEAAAGQASPAALRLLLQPRGKQLGVEIIKARGRIGQRRLSI